MSEPDDRELLEELGVSLDDEVDTGPTAREARLIAGFEEILHFHARHGRAPRHDAEGDIFERLQAVRLDRLRAQADCQALLAPLDVAGLLLDTLAGDIFPAAEGQAPDDACLLAELGAGWEEADADADDITVLKNVRPPGAARVPDDIAARRPCADFARFRPLFEGLHADLRAGRRTARRFGRDTAIEAGETFVLGGQLAHVASVGAEFRPPDGKPDARLRVIFDNGTESDLLRRSLQRALYRDEGGRRLSQPEAGPLFAPLSDSEAGGGDVESGTIYVLRSASDHPVIAAHRELIHKIGVTGGTVEARIAGATRQPTYLLAEVEVVATYELFNINRTRLEKLLHRFFAGARLNLSIDDRFGNPVQPREWFLVPLPIIDQVVALIRTQTLAHHRYDPATASLMRLEGEG